jgi:methylaspartate ammonia-lyase
MKIADMVFSKGVSGYFFDDQKAVKKNRRDGFLYRGAPMTEGFDAIRMPGECVSAGILPEGGDYVFGDCCAVQYSGAGGRDPVFRAENYMPFMEKNIRPLFSGRVFESYRESCRFIDSIKPPLHTAVRYGLSQAFLAAFASLGRISMAEVVAEEYSLPLYPEPVKIFGQCGEDRYGNADKMILKEVDVLPHGLINDIGEKFGRRGEKLLEYLGWLKDRIKSVRKNPEYSPEIHIDIYGLAGDVFRNDISKIADYLMRAARSAEPFLLRVEGPLQADSREAQVELMKQLTREVDNRDIPVELAADEWCNTLEDIDFFSAEGAGHMVQVKTPDLGGLDKSIEAVLLLKNRGVKAYLGGTCNETDISSKACVHAAMAARPYQILAKPGMGFDEGYMLVYNEMQRVISLVK